MKEAESSETGRLPRSAWSGMSASTGSMRMSSKTVPTPLMTLLRVVAVRARSGAAKRPLRKRQTGLLRHQ